MYDDRGTASLAKVVGLLGLLTLLNVMAWGWALLSLRAYPVLLGAALIAWGFGLRPCPSMRTT